MRASDPLPDGMLPDGWAPTGDGLAFEHSPDGLVAGADRQPEDATGATGALPGWRVWYERRAGEATERRTVGTVTTHDAAVDALLTCMRRVSGGGTETAAARGRPGDATSDTGSVDGRWAALSTLAAGVTLHDAVPAAADGDGGVDETSYARSWAARLDGR